MPSNTDFEYAVRRLKRAAIDAYMCGPTPGNADTGGGHNISSDGSCYVEDVDGGGCDIVRPDEDGENGGQFVDDPTYAPFVNDFDNIRSWIEEIAPWWRDLPDPAAISTLHNTFHNVVHIFADDTVERKDREGHEHVVHIDYDNQFNATSDYSVTRLSGLGSLIPNLQRILDRIDDPDKNSNNTLDKNEDTLASTAVDIFGEFTRKLIDAIKSCHEVVRCVDANIHSEQLLWYSARLDATQTVHKIADACERIADQGGSSDIDFNGALTIVALALSVIPIALPGAAEAGAAASAVGWAGLGVSAVSVAITFSGSDSHPLDYGKPDESPIPTYSKGVERLSHGLNGSTWGVNHNVTVTEQAIDQTLHDSALQIAYNQDRFDPTPDSAIEQMTSKQIRYHADKAAEVVTRMNAVGDQLGDAASQVQTCLNLPDDVFRRREARVGIGTDGPYDSLHRILVLLQAALDDLSGKAHKAAANFQIAMSYLAQAEFDAQGLIRTAQDLMDSSHGELYDYLVDNPPASHSPKHPHNGW